MGRTVAFSGIRELGVAWYPVVELAVVGEIGGADELRFGGALGADTVALAAACGSAVARVVYVPFTAAEQPAAARLVIDACATSLVQLRLPRSKRAYLERNLAMLDGADRLVAFTDGRVTGGTAYTVAAALGMGLDVVVVAVGTDRARNPRVMGMPAPTFAVQPYVSARGGVIEPVSETVRALKRGDASKQQLDQVAELVAGFIKRTPELAAADALLPMPRRIPGQPQDLVTLAREIGQRAGLRVVRGLRRVEEPQGGTPRLFRLRFSPEEHARTLRATLPKTIKRPIILDNVLTTGATMAGAMAAVMRDTKARPLGLGVLLSEQGGCKVAV